MEKNDLSSQIIKNFIAALGEQSSFPKNLHEEIRKLFEQEKLSKGSHLKDLLLNFDESKAKDETV